mgnify:CR=1 FL=1
MKTFIFIFSPNRDEKLNLVAKTRSRKLYTQFLTKSKCVVIDDETYVKADFKQFSGQEYYTAANKLDVDPKYKQKKLRNLQRNSEYGKQTALAENGVTSVGSMNKEIYRKNAFKSAFYLLARVIMLKML